jgi:hypothetical protein
MALLSEVYLKRREYSKAGQRMKLYLISILVSVNKIG